MKLSSVRNRHVLTSYWKRLPWFILLALALVIMVGTPTFAESSLQNTENSNEIVLGGQEGTANSNLVKAQQENQTSELGTESTSILDVGPFGCCFADVGLARGFWFTAPCDFTITAVRVPYECSTEVQNVAVMRFNSTIPTWRNTTNDFIVPGLWRGVAGTEWITCNIPVDEGDIIGLLGARGTSTVRNSYGASNTYDTTINGHSTTLHWLGMKCR